MVAVLTDRSSSQADHEFSLCLFHYLLKSERRKVMTFVNDDVAVIRYQIFCLAFPVKALNQCDINASGRFRFSSANLAYAVDGHIKECREPFSPLVEKLGAVDEYERVRPACADQISRSDGLAERGTRA